MGKNTQPVIVIGGSAGAITALSRLLPVLPAQFPLPIVIAIHLHPLQDCYYLQHFRELCRLNIRDADEKEPIQANTVYIAPPNYHLLIEENLTLSLSIDPKVNFSRPSIDVLFESAVDACAPKIIGVILTGANEDGAQGLRAIKHKGGIAIVQDPKTAESPYMPLAAIKAAAVDYVLNLDDIGKCLIEIGRQPDRYFAPNQPGERKYTTSA
jgi:two-component system chemotaxis response regulator CheB